MQRCIKTAWILPNYYSQDIARISRKPGKHSDVSTKAYRRPILGFEINGHVLISLLNRFSYILSVGILDWWPNLINRTDLKTQNVNVLSIKPNMSGHTQVFFYRLSWDI